MNQPIQFICKEIARYQCRLRHGVLSGWPPEPICQPVDGAGETVLGRGMKRIYYAGASILTGERIAESVLRYAEALAKAGSADEIAVPSIAEDGKREEAMLLVGPASQLLAEDEPSRSDLEDPSFVAELDRKTSALGVSQAQPVESESDQIDYDML
ncbi:hypothetical protein [Diaminobutyricibacter sp. McL0608]|uniref:hypothetical protein n=1 Tax=Leifsonia sp. McL0608 TaxID=3143537 RepID=UPI0031F2D7A7